MKRLITLLMALMLLAAPAIAEQEYEDGNPPLSLELYLRGNPTTGYTWSYDVTDPDVLSVIESDFMPDVTEGQATGVGGVFYFRVDGIKSGAADITFTYERSFEENSAVITSTYRVYVDDAMNVIVFENDIGM